MPTNSNNQLHSAKQKLHENSKDDDNDSASVQPIDPLKRKWMVTSSDCDYNELMSLLKEDPNLAGLKVFQKKRTIYAYLEWFFCNLNLLLLFLFSLSIQILIT